MASCMTAVCNALSWFYRLSKSTNIYVFASSYSSSCANLLCTSYEVALVAPRKIDSSLLKHSAKAPAAVHYTFERNLVVSVAMTLSSVEHSAARFTGCTRSIAFMLHRQSTVMTIMSSPMYSLRIIGYSRETKWVRVSKALCNYLENCVGGAPW